MDQKQPISPELTPEQKKAKIQAEIEKLNEFIEKRTGENTKEEKYGPKRFYDTDLSGAHTRLAELSAELKKLEGKK